MLRTFDHCGGSCDSKFSSEFQAVQCLQFGFDLSVLLLAFGGMLLLLWLRFVGVPVSGAVVVVAVCLVGVHQEGVGPELVRSKT